VSGLQPFTTYHFRIVASSPGGTSVGADQIFTTTGLAPTALTTEAGDVTETTARITGTANPRGLDTTYRFDYGTTTAYGATTATQSSRLTASASTPSQNAGAGTTDERVSAPLSGLSPGTTYHYRVVAMSAAGTTSGGDRTFTTPAPPPPAKPPAPTPPPAKPPALAIGRLRAGHPRRARARDEQQPAAKRPVAPRRPAPRDEHEVRFLGSYRHPATRRRSTPPEGRRAQRVLASQHPLRALPGLPRAGPPPRAGAPALHRLKRGARAPLQAFFG